MEAKVILCTHDGAPIKNYPNCLSVSGSTIQFNCPSILKEAGFPVAEATAQADNILENPTGNVMHDKLFFSTADEFNNNNKNTVIFGYGIRSTPKKQCMYGTKGQVGYAEKIITSVMQSKNNNNNIFAVSCYTLGFTERVTDLINLKNTAGVLIDSVKEGPRIKRVERIRINSPSEVQKIFKSVIKHYEQVCSDASNENNNNNNSNNNTEDEQEVLPPYNADTIILQFFRYQNEEDFNNELDCNSIIFINLSDSERPLLCGIDSNQLSLYEKNQQVLIAAAGFISSIKCGRLRMPFGRSKLTQLLRRVYNSEKNNPFIQQNSPTKTYLCIHCLTSGYFAEENYHCIAFLKKMSNLFFSTGIGSIIRDLSVEKWRLEQDTMELKDELLIAKTVYDYKPCIAEGNKNNNLNIKEEEVKRTSAILLKREEVREKQLNVIRQRAKEEAAKLIREQEAASGTTLAKVEKKLELKKKENAELQADRAQRIKDYEQTLEKIHKKKMEEEAASDRLTDELHQLEEELAIRQKAIKTKQKQLEMAKLDKAKGREAILKERESVRAMRKSVQGDRRRQREQWLKQIKEINEKVIEQVKSLAEERRQSNANSATQSGPEDYPEQAVAEDIKSIEAYLPKLISLEEIPVNLEETETIRRQFDEIFAQEKAAYLSKIEKEKDRKEKLEKGLEAYRNRVLEAHQARKKENLQEAVNKEQHLNSLVDQVLTYLRQGVNVIKISSKGRVRRRFCFLSEDRKRIHTCELDPQRQPISRRMPPVTIWIKDIKKIIMGTYTSSFTTFSSEEQLAKMREEAVSDGGTYRYEVTPTITPSNLGLYNYRAFALILSGGKTLEIVCERESDWEAWLVGLKRLLHIKTSIEKILEHRMQNTRETDNSNESNVEMVFGGPLDIRNRRGFVSLNPDEANHCSLNHIPPALFLRVKEDMIQKSQSSTATVYDIRVHARLDLIRASLLYEYLVEKRYISLPF